MENTASKNYASVHFFPLKPKISFQVMKTAILPSGQAVSINVLVVVVTTLKTGKELL